MAAKVRPYMQIQLHCFECKSEHKVNYLPYVGDPNYGNCEVCGCFRNITSAVLAAKQGYIGTEMGSNAFGVVQGIRTSNQKFKAEVPMDQILKRLEQG